MKYFFFNRKSLLFTTLVATTFGLNAQITSTHTDDKYNYTTVVYKDKAATDKEVLAALDNSIGMGDVIRVTVAPPKPAAAPTIDRSKGEDTWLKAAPPINALFAANTPANQIMEEKKVAAKTKVAPVSIAKPVATAKAAPSAKPVASATNSAVKKAAAPAPTAVAAAPVNTTETVAAAPVNLKTKSSVSAKTSKSANKSLKKNVRKKSGSYKVKNRKKGKQRYGCPKF